MVHNCATLVNVALGHTHPLPADDDPGNTTTTRPTLPPPTTEFDPIVPGMHLGDITGDDGVLVADDDYGYDGALACVRVREIIIYRMFSVGSDDDDGYEAEESEDDDSFYKEFGIKLPKSTRTKTRKPTTTLSPIEQADKEGGFNDDDAYAADGDDDDDEPASMAQAATGTPNGCLDFVLSQSQVLCSPDHQGTCNRGANKQGSNHSRAHHRCSSNTQGPHYP
jgi:hypothetical protein